MKQETKEFLKKLRYVAGAPFLLFIALTAVNVIFAQSVKTVMDEILATSEDTVITHITAWGGITTGLVMWVAELVVLGILLILVHVNINEYYIRFGDKGDYIRFGDEKKE